MDKQQLAKEILKKYNIQGYTPPSKQSVDLNSRFAEIDALASGQVPPQEEKKGFGRMLKEEVLGTLIVNPAQRATEALGRTGVFGQNIQRGFEEMEGDRQVNVPGLGEFDVPEVENGKQVVGETLKTASYLIPYGKLATGLAKATGSRLAGGVLSGATGGYTADVGFDLAGGEDVGKSLIPGLGTAIGGAIPAVAPALRATGRLTQKTGEKVVDAVIPASTREAQILQTYKANNPFLKRVADVLKGTSKTPQTAGKTVVERGLMGTKSQIGVQAKRASSEIWDNVISPKLKQAEVQVDLDGFFTKIADDIVKSTDDLTRQKSLLEGLEAIKDDYSGINAVSLEKLQKLKEGWAKFLPSKAFRGQEIGGVVNEVRRLLSNEARGTIYKTLGDDVKTAYLDYGNLQGLKEMGITSMTGQKLKGGAGSFVSELFNQIVTPVGTIGGQGIYKVGKGIEFVGKLGAKNVGQALGINTSKLKFPGDAMVDDLSARAKQIKNTPNKQGGFVKVGQDAKAPIATKTNQTTNNVSNTSIPKSSTKSATKSIDPLISEAKKYKSAEEFVKAKTSFYRGEGGSNVAQGKALLAEGKHFASDAEYPKGFGKVIEYTIKPEAKVLDLGDSTFAEISQKLGIPERRYISPKELAEIAKEKGYGVLKYDGEYASTGKKFNHIVDLTGDSTIPKSQLTDIWKKANKK